MESDKKIEMIEKAIRKVMEDEEINLVGNEDNEIAAGHRRHNQRQFLSKLLSELESLEEDKHGGEESEEAEMENLGSGNCSNEEIMKEVKNVKRQNSITHHLLTMLIVVTLAWQLSEVSLILKIKDGIRNPFKSVGGIIKGFLKGQPQFKLQQVVEQATQNHKQVIEPTNLQGLKLPHLDLPGFYTSNDEDDDDDDDGGGLD